MPLALLIHNQVYIESIRVVATIFAENPEADTCIIIRASGAEMYDLRLVLFVVMDWKRISLGTSTSCGLGT